MSNITIGIGGIAVSNKENEILKTYALGSCIAVIIYDDKTGTGGMAHIALSNSNVSVSKSREKPGYFADTGIPELLKMMRKISPGIDNKDLKVSLIGGSSLYQEIDFFKIGENNIKAAKQIFHEMGLKIFKEDTGKNISRTVEFDVSKNRITISNQKIGSWEL